MDKCEKQITGYASKVNSISTRLPHYSKYFGTAFIPKGELWPVCQNCQREMILLMQLLVSDLPEPPEGQCFEDDDIFQVFTCAYIEPKSKTDKWNKYTHRPIVKDNQNCFNIYDESLKGSIKEHTTLHGKEATEFVRLESEVLAENYDGQRDEYVEDYELDEPFSPFRFVTRVLNIKGKEPTEYQKLPWIDAYHLKLNDDGQYVDALGSVQINQKIKDYLYFWIDQRACFVNNISKESFRITDWEKFSYTCEKSSIAHKIFNGCFSYNHEIDKHKLPNNSSSFNYLGALTIGKDSLFYRREVTVYPDCCCCEKPMTLLCSFGLHYEPDESFGELHGLFYCQETANLQVSLIDLRRS